jgi:hypothetical protein
LQNVRRFNFKGTRKKQDIGGRMDYDQKNKQYQHLVKELQNYDLKNDPEKIYITINRLTILLDEVWVENGYE